MSLNRTFSLPQVRVDRWVRDATHGVLNLQQIRETVIPFSDALSSIDGYGVAGEIPVLHYLLRSDRDLGTSEKRFGKLWAYDADFKGQVSFQDDSGFLRLPRVSASLSTTAPPEVVRKDEGSIHVRALGGVKSAAYIWLNGADRQLATAGRWLTYDIRNYGAVGDGTTDDATAIQAAIDAAAATTGIVYVPTGTWAVGSQIVLKNQVWLVGDHSSASIIKAISGTFPNSTAVVRLGPGTGSVTNCRIWRLGIDCNGVTGSTGVYSTEAQEWSGTSDVQVVNFGSYGIDIDGDTASGNSAQNLSLENTACTSAQDVGTAGIRLTKVSGLNKLRYLSLGSHASSSAPNYVADGLLVTNTNIDLKVVHVERCTDGVHMGTGSTGRVDGVYGHSTVTNLVNAQSQHVVFSNVTRNSSTTTLKDGYWNNILNTDTNINFYDQYHWNQGPISLLPNSGITSGPINIEWPNILPVTSAQIMLDEAGANRRWTTAGVGDGEVIAWVAANSRFEPATKVVLPDDDDSHTYTLLPGAITTTSRTVTYPAETAWTIVSDEMTLNEATQTLKNKTVITPNIVSPSIQATEGGPAFKMEVNAGQDGNIYTVTPPALTANDEMAVLGTAQTFTAEPTFDAGLKTDNLYEKTAGGNITFDCEVVADNISTPATDNTHVGLNVAGGASPGDYTTLVGRYAGGSNTQNHLTAVGRSAAYLNTGVDVTAMGYVAAYKNTGVDVTAMGYVAAYQNTGAYVTAAGYQAARQNTGASVTAAGVNAAYLNTGTNVTAVGMYAAYQCDADQAVALGRDAFRAFDDDTANNFDYTDVDVANDRVTVTAHGWGATGTYRHLRYDQGTSAITGLTDGTVYQVKIYDANTIEFTTANITNAGTGTGHTLTSRKLYDNSIALGYQAEPDAANQCMIGNGSLTEIKSTAKLTLTSTAESSFQGNVSIAAGKSLIADTLAEKTAGSGITADSLSIKDGGLTLDTNSIADCHSGVLKIREFSPVGGDSIANYELAFDSDTTQLVYKDSGGTERRFDPAP